MANVSWKILTKKRPGVTQGLPPGTEDLAWVTNSVTLIHGEHDAILVDTFLSVQHSKDLVDWLAESGKNLVAVYITHSHGDHFLGLKLLLDRFPNARAFATASTVASMQDQIKPDFVRPEVLQGDSLSLEGEELRVVHLGRTDTANTTALHVPSIGLVVSGDAVYNNTHPYLVECDENARGEWLSALDKIEALHPPAVVAGHGVLNPDSSPRHIEETRRYLQDFNAAVASTSTPLELYEKMLTLHQTRVNPGSLWAAAKAAKPSLTLA